MPRLCIHAPMLKRGNAQLPPCGRNASTHACVFLGAMPQLHSICPPTWLYIDAPKDHPLEERPCAVSIKDAQQTQQMPCTGPAMDAPQTQQPGPSYTVVEPEDMDQTGEADGAGIFCVEHRSVCLHL